MGRLGSGSLRTRARSTAPFALLVLAVLHCLARMKTTDAFSNMGNAPPRFDQRPYIHAEKLKAAQTQESVAASSSSIIQGVCYSPFHNPEYPLGASHPGNTAKLADAMLKDFSVIKDYFSVARTYYTSYYGVPVTPAAAANSVKLYLGVYMTNEAWYDNQVSDAIVAINNYPDTVVAVLVGNENIQPAGPYTAKEVSDRITAIRNRIKTETGRSIPVGTVQRATEWLESGDRNAIAALAGNCDIIGVNIYPFFDGNYNAQYPLAILNGIWDKMVNMYPVAKLRLTEIGYPTAGAPLSYAPNNVPSLANSKAFYNAYLKWTPSSGGGESFWFMFFDRAPEDTTMGIELETYFGFYTWQRVSKSSNYPVLASSLGQVAAPTSAPSTVAPGIIPTKVTQGACYSPFHNPEYPLANRAGNIPKLADALNRDFSIMKNFVSVVRTYYSSYYGVPVTPAAAANGVKLYLGVYMTNEAWYSDQVNDAIAAVKNYPDTIAAILIGNENIQPAGLYTAKEVSDRITVIRSRVKAATGRSIPVGTVQRATEWLESGDRNAIAALAGNCDIIGVNIYPFFDPSYNPQYPLAIVNGIWDRMASTYPVAKLRLTEIGYPTAGAPSTYAPKNIPSLENSKAFYNAYLKWTPSRGGGEAFWFMFFDRAKEDNSVSSELERHFGFYTAQCTSKAAGYPVLKSALVDTPSYSQTTPAPTTKAPTTPSPAAATVTIPTLPATNMCRVRKLFVPK